MDKMQHQTAAAKEIHDPKGNVKKVWILNHYAGTPSVTTKLRHFNFAKYLMEAGYEPMVFASSAIHNSNKNLITDHQRYIFDDKEGVPFIYIKTRIYHNTITRLINMYQFYKGLLRASKKLDKPDIIFASSAHPLTLLAGIKIGKRFGIPCIGEIRDLWPESFVAYGIVNKKNPVLKLLYRGEKWLYKKVDKLIFTMQGGKDYICEKGWDTKHGGPVDINKVYHINNGVDLEAYKFNEENYILTDQDLLDKDTFKMIYTGSIRKANNILCLYEAAKIMKAMGISRVKILVYGDGDLKAELEQKIEEDQLDNIILKGEVEKKYIPGIIKHADVLFLEGTSLDLFRFGLSPNKLFDYLAAGKPILSAISSKYDIIIENNCGIVKSSDPEAVSSGIISLLNMPKNEYDEMCHNARKTALEYDFRILTQRLIKIMNE